MVLNTKNYSFWWIFLVIITSIFFGCSNQGRNKTNKEKKVPPNIRKLNDLTVYPVTGKVDTLLLKKVQSYDKHYSLDDLSIPPIAVDDLNRVFMLNKPKLGIDVYDAKGNIVTRLGRKGRGPGEFHEIKWMQILDNHLYVYDRRLEQFQVFSLEPLSYTTTVQTIPKNLNRLPNLRFIDHDPVHIINDSTFLYRFEDMGKLSNGKRLGMGKEATVSVNYYIMNQNQHLQPDTVLHQKGRKMITTRVKGVPVIVIFPFTRRSLIAISENHRIYASRSQDFVIKVYDLKGKYLRAFYYPYQRVPLTETQIDSVIQGASNSTMQQAMRKVSHKTNLPSTWPALHSMKIDDQNRLWISTIVKNQKVYQWWVMNNHGKLLARFRWPRDRPIKAIRNDYVYAINNNHKKGTYRVVKYKIKFKKSK